MAVLQQLSLGDGVCELDTGPRWLELCETRSSLAWPSHLAPSISVLLVPLPNAATASGQATYGQREEAHSQATNHHDFTRQRLPSGVQRTGQPGTTPSMNSHCSNMMAAFSSPVTCRSKCREVPTTTQECPSRFRGPWLTLPWHARGSTWLRQAPRDAGQPESATQITETARNQDHFMRPPFGNCGWEAVQRGNI
jgi:hypothetical protein